MAPSGRGAFLKNGWIALPRREGNPPTLLPLRYPPHIKINAHDRGCVVDITVHLRVDFFDDFCLPGVNKPVYLLSAPAGIKVEKEASLCVPHSF
jgi:hypothetical protein